MKPKVLCKTCWGHQHPPSAWIPLRRSPTMRELQLISCYWYVEALKAFYSLHPVIPHCQFSFLSPICVINWGNEPWRRKHAHRCVGVTMSRNDIMANTCPLTVETAVIKRCLSQSLHKLTLQSSMCSCSVGGKKKISLAAFFFTISKIKAQQQLLKHQ